MMRVDLLVIGGGPAGIGAAEAAAEFGLAVVLVDEGLRPALGSGSVTQAFDHVVWSVSPNLRVDALGPQRARVWTAKAIIVATGARERVLPFPGWTLPGVTRLADAMGSHESQQRFPGSRVMVAGCGSRLAEVAVALLDAGRHVAAVIDLADPADWAAALPRMVGRPDLVARGLGQALRLRAAGVPILTRHGILQVAPVAAGLNVTVGPVDAAGRLTAGRAPQIFEVDALAVGHGLAPRTDVTRLLRAEHRFDQDTGGWCPRLDDSGRTSQRGLYVAGDATGTFGAAAIDGRLVGLAAAHDLGRLDEAAFATLARPLRHGKARAQGYGQAMRRLGALLPASIADLPAQTIVCPCEDLTRADIDAAVAEGATSLNQIKAWTRCGMGSCQGRICGDIVTGLLSARGIEPEASGFWTGRIPLRPLRLDRLIGDYTYADIALPPAAPL